jgi:hypothetical protein
LVDDPDPPPQSPEFSRRFIATGIEGAGRVIVLADMRDGFGSQRHQTYLVDVDRMSGEIHHNVLNLPESRESIAPSALKSADWRRRNGR